MRRGGARRLAPGQLLVALVERYFQQFAFVNVFDAAVPADNFAGGTTRGDPRERIHRQPWSMLLTL
jgi:hypothetical protein